MRVRAGLGVPEGNVIWVRRSGRKGTAGLQTGIAARQRSETERCPPEWRRGPAAPPKREDALGTGSTGKTPGFSQTPDLDYLAGVW